MTDSQPTSSFCGTYPLGELRAHPDTRQVAAHQSEALERLHGWYAQKPNPAGGILVLPTGGGKTFTAVRFLCSGPLSDGYRVLWLAQTHHLLEQAYQEVVRSAGGIAEPKSDLSLRVVSATPGHLPAHSIKPGDDVVIGTLATICRVLRRTSGPATPTRRSAASTTEPIASGLRSTAPTLCSSRNSTHAASGTC